MSLGSKDQGAFDATCKVWTAGKLTTIDFLQIILKLRGLMWVPLPLYALIKVLENKYGTG